MTSTQVVFAGAKKFRTDVRESAGMLDDLTAVSKAVAGEVQRAAGPGTPVLSGRLRGSIRSRSDRRAAFVESNLVYAGVIHYGWRGHGIEPQPWLVDAAHASEPRWVSEYEARVDQAVDNMAKVYAR